VKINLNFEISLKIIDRLKSVKREKWWRLNNEIKNSDINEWNCSETDFSVLLDKIDLKKSIMRENENVDDVCCFYGVWIVSIK
jgi:hypothetical protein